MDLQVGEIVIWKRMKMWFDLIFQFVSSKNLEATRELRTPNMTPDKLQLKFLNVLSEFCYK